MIKFHLTVVFILINPVSMNGPRYLLLFCLDIIWFNKCFMIVLQRRLFLWTMVLYYIIKDIQIEEPFQIF